MTDDQLEDNEIVVAMRKELEKGHYEKSNHIRTSSCVPKEDGQVGGKTPQNKTRNNDVCNVRQENGCCAARVS